MPALLPGLLVAMHYLVQVVRPRMGYGSDLGQRRTPWIVGGMAVLAFGGVLAAAATALMGSDRSSGIALAVLAFALIGVGVSACGTSLLVLLARRVDAPRRAAAATTVWLMMIVGFAVTAGVAGKLLDPYSPARLVAVSAAVSLLAAVVTLLATWRLEGAAAPQPEAAAAPKPAFRVALAEVWAEPVARRFTVFVFISMLAYSAQDLILEPFAGSVFGFTPGESTSLSGVQHGGVLLGMLAAAFAGRGGRFGSLRAWQIGGCLMSALMLLGLVAAGFVGPAWPFKATVFALGAANGAFLDRGHRFDDAARERRPACARRHAHGPVGRGAGGRVRHGRAGRHGGERSGALVDRQPGAGVCGGVRVRGTAVRGCGGVGRTAEHAGQGVAHRFRTCAERRAGIATEVSANG